MTDVTVPRLLKFRDNKNQFREYGFPRSQEFPVVAYAPIEGTNFTSHITVIGRGRSRPLHRTNAEHLIVVLEGEVEFEFPDLESDQVARVGVYDALFIPADVNFRFRQVGLHDAAFSTTVVRKDEWPFSSAGYEQDA